ncbi:MAG: DUF6691 family protein [Mangrovicoccus sp.]
MRYVTALASGSVFGIGLMLSGMVNPAKVQGFMDLFGAWDPTLAFVMGGAIIPMAIAWGLSKGHRPVLAQKFPAPPELHFDRGLIIGSVMFGAGWGLAGLCPGPALASIGFGNPSVWIFVISMFVGMWAAPLARRRLDGLAQQS